MKINFISQSLTEPKEQKKIVCVCVCPSNSKSPKWMDNLDKILYSELFHEYL